MQVWGSIQMQKVWRRVWAQLIHMRPLSNFLRVNLVLKVVLQFQWLLCVVPDIQLQQLMQTLGLWQRSSSTRSSVALVERCIDFQFSFWVWNCCCFCCSNFRNWLTFKTIFWFLYIQSSSDYLQNCKHQTFMMKGNWMLHLFVSIELHLYLDISEELYTVCLCTTCASSVCQNLIVEVTQ